MLFFFYDNWGQKRNPSQSARDFLIFEGARTDSNRRHSEPQALLRIVWQPICTSWFPKTEKNRFAAILRLFIIRTQKRWIELSLQILCFLMFLLRDFYLFEFRTSRHF